MTWSFPTNFQQNLQTFPVRYFLIGVTMSELTAYPHILYLFLALIKSSFNPCSPLILIILSYIPIAEGWTHFSITSVSLKQFKVNSDGQIWGPGNN